MATMDFDNMINTLSVIHKFSAREDKEALEMALDILLSCRECGTKYCKLLKQTKWIPVSERLPEEYKSVIVSTDYGIYPEARYSKNFGWEWAYAAGRDYWDTIAGVIAWMPLPEPYKEEREE